MDFIDDKDLVPVAGRIDINTFENCLANIINTGVRGGIELKNIERAAFGNFEARRTCGRVGRTAREKVRLIRFVTVQCLCKQPCGRRFADAPGTGKKVRMMQTVVFQGVAQRLRNVFLARDFFKRLRAPFSCDYLITHF